MDLKTDDDKKDKVKAEEVKNDDVKSDEVKAEEVKTDEVKAEEVKMDEVKAEEVKTDEVKAESDAEDYRGKYEELSVKYRAALCREMISGENIASEFVRDAIAKEMVEKGFDLESDEGKASAKAFIEDLKKNNPTIFESGKKPVVRMSGNDEGDKKESGIKNAFYKLNPNMKKN